VAHTKCRTAGHLSSGHLCCQTHEMLFDALGQAFRVLGGVPQRGIFNNMRTAVDHIGSGKVDAATAFISDLTYVATRDGGWLMPNPNALLEHGWALRLSLTI
jgi:hypothetical protein